MSWDTMGAVLRMTTSRLTIKSNQEQTCREQIHQQPINLLSTGVYRLVYRLIDIANNRIHLETCENVQSKKSERHSSETSRINQ